MNLDDRDTCARCALKHVAQARALLIEYRMGYPHHVWFAQGHLAEAESESVRLMPDVAADIRKERLRLETEPSYWPAFEWISYRIAFEAGLPEVLTEHSEDIEEEAPGTQYELNKAKDHGQAIS